MRAPIALGALILAFVAVFILFVQSPAPRLECKETPARLDRVGSTLTMIVVEG